MKVTKILIKTFLTALLALTLSVTPLCAADTTVFSDYSISPRYNNVDDARVYISFDSDNMVTCSLSIAPYSHCSGISGLMKLFDSTGTCVSAWSVSDYERPIGAEFTYQGTRGETYTVTFGGYAYSSNQTAPDRLDLSDTGTCNG